VLVDILKIINPSYDEFEQDYKNLYERLRLWGKDEKRTSLIQKILTLQSEKKSVKEQTFWESLEKLNE
jgi:hypothetical protein